MTTKAVKSQKTKLYFVNNDTTPALVACDQVSNASGLGGSKSDIDITNFDSDAKEFLVGLEDPGTLSLDLVFDPTNLSHQDLIKLKDGGTRNPMILCLSDGTTAPTYSAGAITAPTGRTSASFLASVQQVQFDVAKDGAVMAKVNLRLSGSITWTYAA